LSSARDALARLQGGELRVVVSWPDGTEGIVCLGPPSVEQQRTSFCVTTSGKTESYRLAREAAVFDSSPWNLSSANKAQVELTNLAGLYGAVAGSFFSVETRKPANERDLRPSAERIQQFWEVATQIVAAGPAFMCGGRL